jgi:3-hydroxybutyryl-CoA dehydrogenase
MSFEVNTVGIIGAGRIGRGLAQVCGLAGVGVRILDRDEAHAAAARNAIAESLTRKTQRGTLTTEEQDAALKSIIAVNDYAALSDCDLVIEAVSEDETVKRNVFGALGPVLRSDAIIATSASSISITHLAALTDRPTRFIGTHFMHPVVAMPLVELVRGIATEDTTFETARLFMGRLGKTVAVSADFPGFIVNRILLPLINEAVYALHEGVGSIEAIDNGMRLGAHHPMGPLRLADFIGLDTCLSLMQALHSGLADTKYRPCPLLVKYVQAGWLGQKTKRGFYDYRSGAPVPTR